jgi:predicted transposase YbfD/YdcC
MQSTALPPLLTDLPADDRARLLADEALRHLPAVFAAVPDPRGRQGRRYALPFLLTCLVAALLCDCNSTAAIGQWCHERRALLARHFPHQRAHTPTGALYRWLLPRLSVAELEWALASWVRQTRPTRDREPLALDGKVVRGAVTITQPAPHLLSVSTHHTQETLIQVRVSDKTNEIPVAQALLPHLPLRGRVVTADALHTQTALAQVILDHGASYILCVKGNQPRLYAELACYFDDPRATAVSATTIDRRRGRTDTRTLHVTTRLSAYLARYCAFPCLRQVARLIRTVREKGHTRTETVYLITNLTPRRADPSRLLALIRGHWSIESRHWVRDVTFGEDRSRLRGGHAPQIMATLRNLALTLIRRTGATEIAAYRRHLAAHPAKALRFLTSRAHSRQ